MNTLFKKLIVIYVSIILIGFLVLTYTMSKSFETYFMKQKEKVLIEQAESIQREYAVAYKTGVIDFERLNFEIQALDRYLNTRIWLINRNGNIYINSRIEDISQLKKELDLNEIERVFNGEIVRRKGYIRTFFNEPVLTIGYPIIINDRVVFALFMNASIPEIKKTISDIYKIAFISLLFSTIIAIVLVFLISRNLTLEIKKINDAVKKIAKGNFQKRLKVNRNDELGQLIQSFNEMAGELNKLDEMRKRFISNLSHDLRTPLTSINGFVKAILDGTIEKDSERKYLEIVAEESERLTKLTNDILDLSKIESGQFPLERVNFNINELLINEIDKFEKRLLEKDIDVSINLSKEKEMVNGDINQIKRVIYNLIDNAVKFVNVGGKISIETKYKNKKMYISIKNTGEMIPKEDLNRIWDRFYKLDLSRGKDKSGSGLGLSIVKEIIKAHDEHIEVKTEGDWIEFTFTLESK
ncbi:sensor histidine kinase [Caminicella sporogenes]|uniref:sensor histidine kinase n=1 Tax=Caminicella sporogenes TaxID=166485 RepID=UPI00253FAE50|nr:HAMP domain-containing sensor histidine kinase [Caminicella sporogenes]WIF95784.1 HAMP domain-containing sensor histidine kinase [Caminicella sporogenes]